MDIVHHGGEGMIADFWDWTELGSSYIHTDKAERTWSGVKLQNLKAVPQWWSSSSKALAPKGL